MDDTETSALSEPGVDRTESLASLLRLALVTPETREAHRGLQFQGFCLLRSRDRERALEICFCFRGVRHG
jgi:hypothetical protein